MSAEIGSPLKIGVRAHDFGRRPVAELAARIAAKGFSSVQLAVEKAIAKEEASEGLTPEFAARVREAFARNGVEISVLGCYINPIHPDLSYRRELLNRFKAHLRLARDFGCRVVALESGSLNADYSPHAENHGEAAFNEVLISLGELVAEAERLDVVVGLEAVATHSISTPARMRQTLDNVRSAHLQVVLDPVNLLSFNNHAYQRAFIDEALELFGDRIAAVHAKDFIADATGFRFVSAGRGQFDYDYFLKQLGSHQSRAPVLLEEVSEETAAESREFLTDSFARCRDGLPSRGLSEGAPTG